LNITCIVQKNSPTAQKIKSNRSDLEELVERMADLLDPLQKALGNQNEDDISAGLKDDLVRFKRCVLPIYNYVSGD
jgi:hypothetical protein